MYYGFTRFAIELNEIDSDDVHLYPATDTRFRPDQRYRTNALLLCSRTSERPLLCDSVVIVLVRDHCSVPLVTL